MDNRIHRGRYFTHAGGRRRWLTELGQCVATILGTVALGLALAALFTLCTGCAPSQCATDTDCMRQHGGDGGSAPLVDCDRWDCGEDVRR